MQAFRTLHPTTRALLATALVCFSLMFLSGCGDETTIIQSPTGPVDPVSITLAGSCRGGSSIVCADQSTTVPAARIQVVTFFVRNIAGDTVATVTIPRGCATAAQLVPCEVEVLGMPAGSYSVLHSVSPDSGGQPATRIYRDLVVTGQSSVSGITVKRLQ